MPGTGAQNDVIRIAIGGLGAIGTEVGGALVRGIRGLELAAVSARDTTKARRTLERLGADVPVVPLGELAGHAEVVVECAPAAVFRDAAEPALEAGRTLVTASCGALLSNWDLLELAERSGGRIIVPTGALLGLDAVRAAAEGEVQEVRMVTRKPPRGLAGAPHLEQNGIDVMALTEAARVFEGTAREGAIGFPANVNVAAALSLAGIGPDRTRLEIWADPAVSRNTHRIVVEAKAARFEMQIENVPSEANPRTGLLTPLSVIAALRALTTTLKVGS